MLRKCNTCDIEQTLDNYHNNKKHKDGKMYICKTCESIRKRRYYLENKQEILEQQKEYYLKNSDEISKKAIKFREKDYPENLEKYVLIRAKQRAKKNGLAFNLTIDDIIIPDNCPILDIPLIISKGNKGPKPNSPSIDKINPDLGYIKGNIWIISHLANTMKNCATDEQLLKFSQWVLTKQFSYDTLRDIINKAKEL